MSESEQEPKVSARTQERLVAVLHTVDFRGDHAAEIEVPFVVEPGETVEALWARAMLDANVEYGKHPHVRLMAVAEGQ